MAGRSIRDATSALHIFLRSLPSGCKFNIIGFGSTYDSLFAESNLYDNNSVSEAQKNQKKVTRDQLEEANKYLKNMKANLGGTEILKPLEFVFKKQVTDEYRRCVFVLTGSCKIDFV